MHVELCAMFTSSHFLARNINLSWTTCHCLIRWAVGTSRVPCHSAIAVGHGSHSAIATGHGCHSAITTGHGCHSAITTGHGCHSAITLVNISKYNFNVCFNIIIFNLRSSFVISYAVSVATYVNAVFLYTSHSIHGEGHLLRLHRSSNFTTHTVQKLCSF